MRLIACCDSELAREKMWSRIHLIPLLQAEEDRDQVRRMLADRARERELLGAETKVYNSDRCVGRREVSFEGCVDVMITDLCGRRSRLRLDR